MFVEFLLGVGVLVGSVLVRVIGGSASIIWLWPGGRSVRSLSARLSWLRVVRRFGSRCGLGLSAFSSTIRERSASTGISQVSTKLTSEEKIVKLCYT